MTRPIAARLTVPSIALTLGLSIACGATARPAAGVPASGAIETRQLNALYADAIRQSAIATPQSVLPLHPLVAGAEGKVTMATWANCRNAGAANKCGSYAPGQVTVGWDVWAGDAAEFRSQCRKLSGDLVLKLTMLIGLPPPQQPVRDDGFDSQFVTLTVPISKVFRPCTNPRVDTDRCSPTEMLQALPANAPADFYRWFTNQAMGSWRTGAPNDPPIGYPWTRLGYTYNWAPESTNHYGVSEYVIPGSISPMAVDVLKVQTARDFCRANDAAGGDGKHHRAVSRRLILAASAWVLLLRWLK